MQSGFMNVDNSTVVLFRLVWIFFREQKALVCGWPSASLRPDGEGRERRGNARPFRAVTFSDSEEAEDAEHQARDELQAVFRTVNRGLWMNMPILRTRTPGSEAGVAQHAKWPQWR